MASLRSPLLSPALFNRAIPLLPFRSSTRCESRRFASISTSSFTWDDVLRVSHPQYPSDDDSDLAGFFEKIRLCNRGSEMQSDFLPLVVEDQIAGYVHHGLINGVLSVMRGAQRMQDDFQEIDLLPRFDGPFNGSCFGKHVGLHQSLKTPEDRTEAVVRAVKCLGPELVPGSRNQLFPVKSSFGGSIIFSLERATAPYFGIKAYGVHMNGYVEKDGQEYLWIAKRSQVKPTYPGMLDDLIAGGLTNRYRSQCGENLIKECEEEAGIPRGISCGAIPVGAVSYMDIDGYSYKRDVFLCYDLKLPEGFSPNSQVSFPREVESFKLIPGPQVANVVRRTEFFKPYCSLVIIDFLLRNGYIKPEYVGYLDLVRSLKSGDCS